MNTTFTTCAEKKAKQFLNLLQGYTKSIRMTAILILLLMGVSNAWALDIYLDISAAYWPTDGATLKLYPGTGSDITGTSVATNLYKFTVTSATGTMWFKRMSGSSTWNQASVSYNSSYNLYKLTGWNAAACSNANVSIATKTHYIYFDNSTTNWSNSYKYFVIGHDYPSNYSKVYSMSALGHTKLWYVSQSSDSWTDLTYYAICSPTSSWSGTSWGSSNISNANKYAAPYKGKYDMNNGSSYLFTPASSSNNCALTIDYKNGYSALNYSQTLKKYTSTDNGSSYSAASINSGIVTITPYKLTGNGTVSNSSNTGTIDEASETSVSKDAVYTGEVTVKASENTGYDFVGWFTAASGGSAVSTETSYTYNAPKSTKTIYARFKAQRYSITYKDQGNATFSGTHASGYPTTHTYGTATTLKTASKTGYTFEGWHTDAACTNKVTSLGATEYTANITLYAKWILKATYSLNVVAGDGISQVAGSTDPITLGNTYDIKATPKTGYTFSTWTANPAGNATFGSATTANTTVTVKNGSVTVTATATENMSTLTTSNNYTEGNPGYAAPIASVNSIGYETTATVTATAAGNGYTFTGWTLTNCTRTDGGADDATFITVRSNGDSKAATVVANYAEDLATTKWYISGNGNGSGNDLTPGSPFTGWATNGIQMFKKSGYSTEEIYYCTITANTVASSDDHFPFKVYNATTSEYWGNSGYWVTKENNHPTLSSENSGDNMKFRPYLVGTYEFKLDATNASSPVLTVTWPVYNQLRISAANPADATNTGEFDMTGSGTYTVTRSLKANTAYTFKIVYNSEWYGASSGNLTRASSSKTLSTSSNNLTLKTDIAGNYTFTFNGSNKQLTVTYPTAYKITYGVGTNKGTDAVTTSPSITSGELIDPSISITFSKGDTEAGYIWKNWNSKADGTGTELGRGDTYVSSNRTEDISVYACYDLIIYDITYNLNGGTNPNDAPTSYNITTTTFNLPTTPTKTGYTFAGWFNNEELTGNAVSQIAQGSTDDKEFWAKWTANTYTVKFNANGGSGSMADQTFTYNEEEKALTANTFTQSGYDFVGWNTLANGTGTPYTDSQKVQNLTDKANGTITLYAQWQGAEYTVTLDQTGAASQGTEEVTAHYEADMPDIDELPVAQDGYAFMGYWDKKDGQGTQYYDSVGTSAHTWDKIGNATLYAYFKAAEITINLNAASFEPNSATPVIATATLTPTPVGTTSICWELLYNDDTPVAEHDPQETVEPNQVQFNINDLATGTYQIKATLREGTGCTGTIISHATQVFTITSDHTITIKYVDENGQTIKASTTQSAHVSSLTEITAPEIIGYTFKEWEAGDGVSIKDATDGKKNTPDIEYNAYYDGYLKAIYTKNSNIIYFYNTLGWENVYVYFYSGDYWDNNKGTGTKSGGTYKGYLPMVRMGESNIWYVNAADKATTYLVFGKDEQDNYDNFSDTEVIRRGDYNSSLPMFVPIADQEPTELNNYTDKEGKKCVTKYYNKGYWMNYPDHSGYTLDLFNHHSANDPARYFIYPYSQDTIFPLQIQVDINAENIADDGKKKIWFRIHRNDGKNFGGNANTFPSVKPGTTGGFITENDYKVELITPIAGTYTFILDYKYDETAEDYKYHISVDYPAAVGDYRILYRDEAEKTWSGKDKNKEGDEIKWYHASRVIKKGTDTKDIISFFINKDIRRTLSYQTIEDIDENGNITWSQTEEQFSNVDWSMITESGVYNFVFVQDGKGISLENTIEPYTGQYYIRCDAMGGGWEDYKTNSENRMTYSSFSESDANSFGDKFSHYATKWCEAGTNVKFTIANDYSQCISDTLAQDVIPLGNLTDEGTLLNNDIYDANIRFMWNWKTNKISRAYVGPAGDKQSQFLMLRSCSEFKDAVGNDLDPNEGDILDKENDIYAARFTDTENWLYERTIQVKPRTRVKLYASYPKVYHIYIENLTGWKDVALYAWKDGGDQPLGNWPGIQPTRTVEIEDKTYYDFQVSEYVFGSNLIFNNTKNNNDGGQQKDDYQIQTIGDYYFTASSNSQLSFVKKVSTTVEATAQYFRGAYAEGSCDNENTVQILGGEGETWNTIRVIYDFKTNRLMAAWMPNNNEIDTVRSIESDVMIIRDHQNAAQCITFANDSSKLTKVKTVYGVMRFNRWVLNNRGGQDNLDVKSCGGADSYDENTTNSNHPVLQPAEQKSQYERALYFISFPFDVNVSDIFGFGTYGQHWIIEYYDGLKRAREGYWIDSDPNWKYVTNPDEFVLEKYKGYILCLNLSKMAYNNTDFWAHNISQVELFFPSTTTMEEIAKAEVTMPALGDEYLCTINRNTPEGDRRVKDSYWRCIGVPSYANYSNVLKDEEGDPIQWQTSYKTFPFLYRWNKTDNTLTPQSTTNFKFETMHAYLVQNGGEIHWSAVNATPDKPNAGIIAKVKETTRNYEWRITLTQGEKEHDQAFVRLSDDEKVTTEFDFNQDLSKEFNYGRSDIYTLIGYEKAAANSLPLSEQTTLIPLGLSIEYNGDYTIAMPDGTANIGVTLIDTESNTRTNLSAGMEYTLTLKKGDYNNRFFIEISPIQQTPTDIEYVENSHDDQARKVLIDNILYIVRDGQMFDARGARVK